MCSFQETKDGSSDQPNMSSDQPNESSDLPNESSGQPNVNAKNEKCKGCSKICEVTGPKSILKHLSTKGVKCKDFYTDVEIDAFKKMAKSRKSQLEKKYKHEHASRVLAESEKSHETHQKELLKRFEDKIRHQFLKKGYRKPNNRGGYYWWGAPFEPQAVKNALLDKCQWKIDDDITYVMNQLKELKDSKKFDDPTYYKFLSLKHKILYEKENTLRNLKTKIAKTSPKIKKLAELDSFVREELDTSDDLMNDILKEIHEL